VQARAAAFGCHPGAGRRRFSTTGWLVIQFLIVIPAVFDRHFCSF
jgi:hypothetical protein